MSKIYIVGHADGRRVYEHVKLPRFYVKSEPCNDPELRLFRIRGCKDEYEIGYLFSRSKGLSPIAEEYLAILREELAANPLLA